MSEQVNFVRPVPPVGGRSSSEDGVGEGGILVPGEGPTITPLQNTAYIGIIASICVFGFAAVISFQRGIQQSKKLKPVFFGFGIILVGLAIHAGINSRMFAAYLNGDASEASLFYRVAGWVIFAPVLAWLRLSLFGFGRGRGLNQIIDSALFAGVFLIAAIGLQSAVPPTASIIFALLAMALYLVIIARSFGLKKKGLEALPGFLGTPHKLIWDTLVFGPVIIPLLVVMRAFGLEHDLIHLLLTLGEIIIVLGTVAGVALCTTKQFDAVDGGEELNVQVDSDVAAGTDFFDPFGDATLIAENKKNVRPKTVIRTAGKAHSIPPKPTETEDPFPEAMEGLPLGQDDMEAPTDLDSEDEGTSAEAGQIEIPDPVSDPSPPPARESSDTVSEKEREGDSKPAPNPQKPTVKAPPKPKRRF